MTGIDPDTERNAGVNYMGKKTKKKSIGSSRLSIKTCKSWMTNTLRQSGLDWTRINAKTSQRHDLSLETKQTHTNETITKTQKTGDINISFYEGCPVNELFILGPTSHSFAIMPLDQSQFLVHSSLQMATVNTVQSSTLFQAVFWMAAQCIRSLWLPSWSWQ